MRPWIVIAGAAGFLAVAIGAFAAHGMEAAGDARGVELLEKASRYLMWHALAIGLVVLLAERRPEHRRALRLAGGLFVAGMVLFCGTLIVLALTPLSIAIVAPFGGTAFLAGWLTLGWVGLKG